MWGAVTRGRDTEQASVSKVAADLATQLAQQEASGPWLCGEAIADFRMYRLRHRRTIMNRRDLLPSGVSRIPRYDSGDEALASSEMDATKLFAVVSSGCCTRLPMAVRWCLTHAVTWCQQQTPSIAYSVLSLR